MNNMKKLKKQFVIFSFLVSLVVGIGFAFQMKVSDGQRLYVSYKAIEDYKVAIKGEKADLKKLKEILKKTEQKVADYEKFEDSQIKQSKLMSEKLQEELFLYKTASGSQKIHGPGVEILVDDATREIFEHEDVNNLLVHDMDLLMIINELNRCKAEAISVNGQRITPKTAVVCSGYTVRINGEVYARPFTIRAIGDAKRMYEALLAKEGYGAALKEWGVQFEVKISDNIVMEPVAADYLNIYMKKVQGEGKK
ncbi:MAG: DUF881 domain-containing protein [Eubacteriales bacterium]